MDGQDQIAEASVLSPAMAKRYGLPRIQAELSAEPGQGLCPVPQAPCCSIIREVESESVPLGLLRNGAALVGVIGFFLTFVKTRQLIVAVGLVGVALLALAGLWGAVMLLLALQSRSDRPVPASAPLSSLDGFGRRAWTATWRSRGDRVGLLIAAAIGLFFGFQLLRDWNSGNLTSATLSEWDGYQWLAVLAFGLVGGDYVWEWIKAQRSNYRECPSCTSRVPKRASVCPKCGRDLPPVQPLV